jgi:serine phosphatase RsbU (regulator of sigma subunit)/AcrR family transcriptional regulator
MPTPKSTSRRADAQRNRHAILEAAVRELGAGGSLDMQRLAAAARVSRSTLYRHFPTAEAVREAVLDLALEDARAELEKAVAEPGAPLAVLRRALLALIETGRRFPLTTVSPEKLAPLVPSLDQLADSLCDLAELDPRPPRRWLRQAAADLAEAALLATDGDQQGAASAFLQAVTGPLDQALVVLDPKGGLLGINAQGAAALAIDRPKKRGRKVKGPAAPTFYEDGSKCPADAYPLARAAATHESQPPAIRGHRFEDDDLRWFSVTSHVLGDYGIVGVLTDVTEEKRHELTHLRPPGTLGGDQPAELDVARVLDTVPAHLLPEQLVAEARRLTNVPVALYVVDIDGSHLLRLAGAEDFPQRIEAPLALGPELSEAGIEEVRARLEAELPGVTMAPMWLRGRAVGILLALRGPVEQLVEVAQQGAPAMELANGYTDVFDAARRRKDINPAAEIQQSLLPPRIARLGSGEVASGMLPSYEVGGDWFDYVENRDGAWIAIADAAGRGARAAALGSIALAALRAARRNDASLEEASLTVHETVYDAGEPEFFLTGVIARWNAAYEVFSWVNAGHPPPLLLSGDGSGKVEELASAERALPFGLGDRERQFRRGYRRLDPGDRVILYTDGISTRMIGDDAFFGRDGIATAARSADGSSAPAMARAIQGAVVAASDRPLRDDAAVVVFAPGPPSP